jgi:hypothetical protein
MTPENKVEITVHRDLIGKILTDREWEVLASHIEGATLEFIENSFDEWLDNIDELVAEEDRYE